MSIKKQILKSKPVCKVTFKVEKDLANGATAISILGDFNQWDPAAGEMKAMKDGSFSITLELETGREYQFRYLADGQQWLNESESDGFVESEFGDSENSVISV